MMVLLKTVVMKTHCRLGSQGGLRMKTHCRLSSQGGLFRTVSRSGLGGGFRQREQHLDHVDPVNEDCENVIEEKGGDKN